MEGRCETRAACAEAADARLRQRFEGFQRELLEKFLCHSSIFAFIIHSFRVCVNTQILCTYNKGGGDVMRLRLYDIRDEHHKLQKELAEYLHCTQQTYSRYEIGEVEPPCP